MSCEEKAAILIQTHKYIFSSSFFLSYVAFVFVGLLLLLVFFNKRERIANKISFLVVSLQIFISLMSLSLLSKVESYALSFNQYSLSMTFIIFPLWYVFYFIRQKDESLLLKAIVLVPYVILFPVIFYLGYTWILEQMVFQGRICLGVSCSLCR